MPNAKFQADFSSFLQAINQADVKLADFGKGATKVEGSLNRMVDSFSGRKLIQEASLMTIAVEKAGGTATLTAREMEQLGNKVNEAAEKMRKLGYDVPAGMQKLADETKAATSAGEGFGSMMKSVNGVLGAFGLGLTITAVIGFARGLLDAADSLTKLHDKTGISIEGLERFQAAGDDAGNTIDEISDAILKMEDRLVGGDKAALGALARLGIQFSDIKSLSPEQQFVAISDALRKVQDPAEQVNIAIDLFGKSGAAVLPVLKRGFDDLKGSAVGMSRETVKALDDAGDSAGRFWRAVKTNLGEALADVMTLSLSSTRRLKSEFDAMVESAERAAPKMAKVVPPGLPKDLDVLDKQWETNRAALEKAAEAHKKAAEDAKRNAAEVVKLTAEVHKLEGGLFLIPESLGKVGRSFDDAKFAKVADEVARVEQAAHIANFGFAGMVDSLRNVGQAGEDTSKELARLDEFVGPKLQTSLRATTPLVDSLDRVLSNINNRFVETAAAGLRAASEIEKIRSSAADAGEALTKGDWLKIAAIGVSAVATAFGKLFGLNAEKQINPIRQAFIDTAGGLAQLNARAHEAGVTLTALLNAKNPEQYKKAIDDLNAAFKFSDDAMATLDETAKRYGFTLEELGPAMQRQELDKQAAALLKDWTVLNAAGIDTVAITGRMAEGVNDYVRTAVRMGVEIPAAMKPMLQSMVDQGLLTDAAGNKIENLNDAGITWSQTMTEGFKSVVEEVRRLADAISGRLGVAIANIPKSITTDVDVNINGRWNIPTAPREAEFVAQGGLVTASGIQYLGTGGRVLRFTPRGSDTVPAMLTPGERVLSVQQNRAYEATGTDGGAIGERLDTLLQRMDKRDRELPSAISRAVVYAVQKVSKR